MEVTEEHLRLDQDDRRQRNWKRWGPYLSERQWGTVREDYSHNGESWTYFPHDHARSRAYRWGEDGLLGISDRQARICFSCAYWNGSDAILKERLFGLSGPEGNHGEDVKEYYYYLDSTPTHSYLKALYKYPQAAFPYKELVLQNSQRGRDAPEYELFDSGVFEANRYFDCYVEYCKCSPNDLLIRLTAYNRGDQAAPLYLLPTIWFRNTWNWDCEHEGCWGKPGCWLDQDGRTIRLEHQTLPTMYLHADPESFGASGEVLFTENETNRELLFDVPNQSPYVKDAFHRYLIDGDADAVNPRQRGTKAAFTFHTELAPGDSVSLRLRLCAESEAPTTPFGATFDDLFHRRIQEADEFYRYR